MKATNWVRKTLALGLIFLMVAALMGTSAFADAPQPVTSSTTGTITVSGISDQDKGNVTISFYRLTELVIDEAPDTELPQASQYIWTDGVAAWVKDNYPDYIYGAEKDKTVFIGDVTDNSVTQGFRSDNTAIDAEKFYDELANYITEHSIPVTRTVGADGTTNVTVSGLPMGNYLILISGGVSVYRPATAALIPTVDTNGDWNKSDTVKATVNVKASAPDLSKTITAADSANSGKLLTAAIGDKIPFKIEVTVPTYPKISASKVYKITDTMSEGLVFNRSDLMVKGIRAQDAGVFTLAEKTDDNPAGIYTVTENDGVIVIEFDYEAIRLCSKLEITYTATLGDKAKIGSGENSNAAILTYSNAPHVKENEKDTPRSDATVYTYGIKVTKVDARDESIKLAGAHFRLIPGADRTSDASVSFVAEAESGVYHKALPEEEGATTDVVTGNGGLLTLKGLDEGNYILVETAPPPGYFKPTTDDAMYIALEIKDQQSGADALPNGLPEVTVETEEGGGTVTTTVETNGYISCTVPNATGTVLPRTGGSGTAAYTAAGTLLVIAGIFGLAVTAVKRRCLSK